MSETHRGGRGVCGGGSRPQPCSPAPFSAPWGASPHPGWGREPPLVLPFFQAQPKGTSCNKPPACGRPLFGQMARNLGACHSPWLSAARCRVPTTSRFNTRPLEQGQCRARQVQTLNPHMRSDRPSAGSLGLRTATLCVSVLGAVAADNIQNLENELKPTVATSKLILTFWVPRPSWLLPSSCPHPDGLPGPWPWPWPPDWFSPLLFLIHSLKL